jgi:hypothetical protein
MCADGRRAGGWSMTCLTLQQDHVKTASGIPSMVYHCLPTSNVVLGYTFLDSGQHIS